VKISSKTFLCAVLYAIVAILIIITSAKVLFLPPEHDEAELLHASWLIAQGGAVWIDFFENHLPLYLEINAALLDPNSPFFVLQAKITALAVYHLTSWIFATEFTHHLELPQTAKPVFIPLAAAIFIVLTWPVDVGMVRPENYAVAAAMAALCVMRLLRFEALLAARAASLCIGLLLAIAVSLSLRSILISAAGAIWFAVMVKDHSRRNGLLLLAVVGAAAIVAVDLHLASFELYYRWMVEFNGQIRPIRRDFPAAAYGSLAILVLSIPCVAVACILAWSRNGKASVQARWPSIAWPTRRQVRPLLAIQLVVVMQWLYAFFDNSWGRQSFSGVAVASTVLAVSVLAMIFKACMNLPMPRICVADFRRAKGAIALLAALGAGATAATLAAVKIDAMISRLQPAGTWRDLLLTRQTHEFALAPGEALAPLNESRNLAEWLLWARRQCLLFRNERVLLNATRHPVCVRDVSYYWYGGIHISAMALDGVPFVPIPPYRLAHDVAHLRPVLIDINSLKDFTPAPQVEAMLDQEYRPLRTIRSGHWGWIRNDFATRP
jgi:hypothetical protein